MKRFVTCFLALVVVLALGGVATAKPPWGASCSGCHGGDNPNGSDRLTAMGVVSDTMVDPDESAVTPPADWKDRGFLKTFTAQPGDTVDLTMEVLDGESFYAVQLKRFEKQGLGGNVLAGFITPDSDWTPQGSFPSTYYTESFSNNLGYDWPVVPPSGPDPYTFTLALAADTPLDVYDLEFATAGYDVSLDKMFYGDEHFYLRVVPEPGVCVLLATGL
ncbi:MAG: hypothetical protein ACYSWU_08285, partial [Planctomycetota bacterium]